MKKLRSLLRFLFVAVMLFCVVVLIWYVPAKKSVDQSLKNAAGDLDIYREQLRKQVEKDHPENMEGILAAQNELDSLYSPELDEYQRLEQAKKTLQKEKAGLQSDNKTLKTQRKLLKAKVEELYPGYTQAPEQTPEPVPEQFPEGDPDTIPEMIPETRPETIPGAVPGKIPQQIPDTFPEQAQDEAPERTVMEPVGKQPAGGLVRKQTPDKVPEPAAMEPVRTSPSGGLVRKQSTEDTQELPRDDTREQSPGLDPESGKEE